MSAKTTITLPEKLDISQVDSIKDRMDKTLSKDATQVEVNADKVERIDSAGIQLLLSFIAAVKEAGKEVHLLKPSDELLAAAEMLGTTELLGLQ